MAASKASRHSNRVGFVLVVLIILANAILIPLALVSLISSFSHPANERAYPLGGKIVSHPRSFIDLDLVGLNEIGHTVSIRVTGNQVCSSRCSSDEQIRLFSVGSNPVDSFGSPPSTIVDLPADQSEINTVLTLPITGSLAAYPFDTYRLVVGIELSEIRKNAYEVPIGVASARSQLRVSVGEELQRIDMGTPNAAPERALSAAGVPLAYSAVISLGRPLYLQILTILLVALVTLSAAYAVLLRPFRDVIPMAGVVILGVWGVRSLLVGSYPADSTATDLSLVTVILFLLIALAARGLSDLWRAGFAKTEQPEDNQDAK